MRAMGGGVSKLRGVRYARFYSAISTEASIVEDILNNAR